jgi:hypothetical protein
VGLFCVAIEPPPHPRVGIKSAINKIADMRRKYRISTPSFMEYVQTERLEFSWIRLILCRGSPARKRKCPSNYSEVHHRSQRKWAFYCDRPAAGWRNAGLPVLFPRLSPQDGPFRKSIPMRLRLREQPVDVELRSRSHKHMAIGNCGDGELHGDAGGIPAACLRAVVQFLIH